MAPAFDYRGACVAGGLRACSAAPSHTACRPAACTVCPSLTTWRGGVRDGRLASGLPHGRATRCCPLHPRAPARPCAPGGAAASGRERAGRGGGMAALWARRSHTTVAVATQCETKRHLICAWWAVARHSLRTRPASVRHGGRLARARETAAKRLPQARSLRPPQPWARILLYTAHVACVTGSTPRRTLASRTSNTQSAAVRAL